MMALERASATAGHWSDRQYGQLFAAAAPPRLALVLEFDSTIKAFLVARGGDADWELENIVVADDARRQRLGSRLLQLLLEKARKARAESVVLEVRESNLPARSLYEKWGLVESGKRPGYYSHPHEAAILYRLCFQ
jgi:ribosomal-protein-alanine N-acetyltransferase